MGTLECRGSTEEKEREKIYLDDAKKRNRLLDLDIEMKKVELEIKKVELNYLKRGQK